MKDKVLFLGDHDIDDAARYLAGCLKLLDIPYDYIPSEVHTVLPKTTYRLYILSDYPSKRWKGDSLTRLVGYVEDEGASLWMIGGWGSFRGYDGNYGETPLQKILPVWIAPSDDRIQGGALYRLSKTSECRSRLNFLKAPSVAGFNRFKAKPGARVEIEVNTFGFASDKKIKMIRKDPMLVFADKGNGRTAALATDLAPHWCGGLVDWGKPIDVRLNKKVSASFGSDYLRLVEYILKKLW